jgi:hypothetical protein
MLSTGSTTLLPVPLSNLVQHSLLRHRYSALQPEFYPRGLGGNVGRGEEVDCNQHAERVGHGTMWRLVDSLFRIELAKYRVWRSLRLLQ